MGPLDAGALHVAAILNAAYMVRYYARGGRTSIQRTERAAAIQAMGLTVRAAFNESENFEPLLTAIIDGLTPDNRPRF
jgi:hypothetical protein